MLVTHAIYPLLFSNLIMVMVTPAVWPRLFENFQMYHVYEQFQDLKFFSKVPSLWTVPGLWNFFHYCEQFLDLEFFLSNPSLWTVQNTKEQSIEMGLNFSRLKLFNNSSLWTVLDLCQKVHPLGQFFYLEKPLTTCPSWQGQIIQSKGLSLNRSRCDSRSTKYDTPAGT